MCVVKINDNNKNNLLINQPTKKLPNCGLVENCIWNYMDYITSLV